MGSQNNVYLQSTVAHRIGKKGYEFSNHLGNVLSVISDKLIPHSNGATIDYWLADILQSTDYSPFGVQLSGRNLKLSGNNVPYVYFYQGSEMDKEVKGDGNSYTTTFRQLDPRLGRWMSLDPLMYVFPWQTPYNSMDNNPIYFNDIFGLKSEGWGGKKNENGTTSWDYDSEITKDNYKSKGYTEYMDEGYLAKGINRETGETGEWWLTKEGKGVNYSKLDETIINSNNIEKQQDNIEIGSNYNNLENPINNSKKNQINGSGLNGKNLFEIGFGVVGTYFDIKGNAIHNNLYWKGKTTGKIYTKNPFIKTNVGWKANSYKATSKAFQGAKSFGTKLGVAGLLLTGYDIVLGDGLTTSNMLDATFGAAGFLPGVGWIFSGSYFIINTGFQLYSGKSIGEYLDD